MQARGPTLPATIRRPAGIGGSGVLAFPSRPSQAHATPFTPFANEHCRDSAGMALLSRLSLLSERAGRPASHMPHQPTEHPQRSSYDYDDFVFEFISRKESIGRELWPRALAIYIGLKKTSTTHPQCGLGSGGEGVPQSHTLVRSAAGQQVPCAVEG